MKIGILTFHWATNYGAVLQCFALQEYLRKKGHEVKVINYKPRQYEETLYKFLKSRKFLHLSEYITSYKQEKALKIFRHSYLHLTERIYTCQEVSNIARSFDLIISGSDQVTNPSFLMNGEGVGVITPTYFLGFPFNGKRIGYALSFGCVNYPEHARKVATKYIHGFNAISVRENTGVDIVKSMGRDDALVVPDPTLLMNSEFYYRLADTCTNTSNSPYIYSFFIRHITERKVIINRLFQDIEVLWNNDDGDFSMRRWLLKIKQANLVLTDSFHCVVMCLKLHKPFIVITEENGNVGMNDRLYTLLGELDLEKCIVYKCDLNLFKITHNISYHWDHIDEGMARIKQIGVNYLDSIQISNK